MKKNDTIYETVSLYLESVNNSGYKILTDLKFYGDENLLKPKIREIYAKLKLNAKEEIGYIPEYTRDKKKNNVDRRTKKQIFKAMV